MTKPPENSLQVLMQHRIDVANAALDAQGNYMLPSEDMSENIIDLITNLCHKARAEGFSPHQILRVVGMHCETETKELHEETLSNLAAMKKKTAKKPKAVSKTLQSMLPGTDVVVRADDGSLWHTQTRSFPWQLGHGTWVVSLVGKTGGYELDRVNPVKEKKPKRAK